MQTERWLALVFASPGRDPGLRLHLVQNYRRGGSSGAIRKKGQGCEVKDSGGGGGGLGRLGQGLELEGWATSMLPAFLDWAFHRFCPECFLHFHAKT